MEEAGHWWVAESLFWTVAGRKKAPFFTIPYLSGVTLSQAQQAKTTWRDKLKTMGYPWLPAHNKGVLRWEQRDAVPPRSCSVAKKSCPATKEEYSRQKFNRTGGKRQLRRALLGSQMFIQVGKAPHICLSCIHSWAKRTGDEGILLPFTMLYTDLSTQGGSLTGTRGLSTNTS